MMADTLPLEGEKIKHYSIIFTPPPPVFRRGCALPLFHSEEGLTLCATPLFLQISQFVVAIPQFRYFSI
jgi:hypothetical protein